VYNEQIVFYKEKNQELEDRVDNHIKVNKDLRESIERLLKGQNDEYSIAYYKDQLTKSSETIIILQEKLKKLQLEMRKLKDEMGRVESKPVENYSELEIRIV
jgi:cyclopropane fatty-acyl-phospholipid synthase-like methyltransferase